MKIFKRDYYRVLLTEVLPYEIPIWYSNRGFYSFVKALDKSKTKTPVNSIFVKHVEFPTPYKYFIKKNATGKRQIYLVHPLIQREFISFYKKYDEFILSHCGKSPISLRYPSKVASLFYRSGMEKTIFKILDKEIESADDDENNKFSSSYFSYSDFGFIYKFFDSYKFNRLEKKFNILTRFDIGSCFNNVYTHSIIWATRGKLFGKEAKNHHTFEKVFDELMQKTKSKETNGIVIGPEFSRIFAEIILQKIDLSIIHELEKRHALKFDFDYSIKRYIDDYFLFTKNEETSRKIIQVIEELLSEFNFSLNPSKTKTYSVPYVSRISIAKTQLNTVFKELTEIIDGFESNKYFISANTPVVANKYIHQIKTIIVGCDVDADSVNNYLFARLRRSVFKFITLANKLVIDEENRQKIINFSSIIFDVLFYFFCIDARPRATYILSQIVYFITENDIFSKDLLVKEALLKKISDEIILSINKISNSEENFRLELINMLQIHRQLGDEYLLDERKILSLTNLNKLIDMKMMEYFQIISILNYIQGNINYSNLRNSICEYVVKYFESTKDAVDRADGFCLFFDFISCPYIDISFKSQVVGHFMKSVNKGSNMSHSEIISFIGYVCNREWFTVWGNKVDISHLLEKFELKPVY